MTPHQAEGNANNVLGHLLRPMLGQAEVVFESTRVLAGQSGKRPDILVAAPGRSPVVIEAEYAPARTVEPEAIERLGQQVQNLAGPIEAAIALRYPDGVANAYDQQTAIADARLSYCVFTLSHPNESGETERFPQSGWLDGSVSDLADLIRLVSVPQSAVELASDYLQQGIDATANILEDMDKTRPAVSAEIARRLGMDNVPQTRRMAGAIMANALIFHERIAGMHQGIKPLNQVCGDGVADPQGETLNAWAAILAINYYPIFAIGRDLLAQLPAQYATLALHRLRRTAAEVNGTGVSNSHDLTGRVFQRLISDRKYLATFYTLPASAALLARLAVAKLNGVDWADADAIGRLRIGDFACGTGALLSAVYEQIAARHENAGGDAAALHPAMMEDALYGCDVMPSAIHITGSTLSGMQPEVGFGNSRLYTMPYGRQDDGSVKIGSLELLQSSQVMTLFNTSDPALRTGSAGEETAAQVNVDVPDAGFDLVIMNPPFTRATNHEGAHANVVNPAFAAFNASKDDMDDMGKRLNQIGKNTCYHGNAGIASAFAALAHRKLKPGGILALVLPLSAAAGLSWQSFRQMVATNYSDLDVLSIAADGKEMSFSSDTGMAECLVVARKHKIESASAREQFLSLKSRPQGFAHSAYIANIASNSQDVRGIEDGPFGGSLLLLGDESTGEILTSPVDARGGNWGEVRMLDYALAQTAYHLTTSNFWIPGISNNPNLPISPRGEIGRLGLVSRDINGPAPRGSFDKTSYSPTATYPALWNHDAKQETKMICLPDSQLLVRMGMEDKAASAWEVVSRAHLNVEFTFGSQPLTAAFTERESMGGRVWPNVKFPNDRFDYVFTLWNNSTLGLLLYWWHSSRQQSSKATVSIRSAETLPVLDFRALSDGQLAAAESIFDEFRDLELMPAYLADADANRALLDRRVVCDLLGFDEDVYRGVRRLAAKWCAEPSVHGGKQRPKTARYTE